MRESKLAQFSLLTVALIGSSLAASGNAAQAAEPGPKIKAIGSDQYPAYQTRPLQGEATFSVVADNRGSLTQSWLDGKRLPDRAMADEGGERVTQIRVNPGIGTHTLRVRVLSKSGRYTETSRSFSVGQQRRKTGHAFDADGNPVAGATVAFYATFDSGRSRQLLASTTTAADGTWALPSNFRLPRRLLEAANANDGVLNLEAVFSGTRKQAGATTPVFGISMFSIAAGSKANGAAGKAADNFGVEDMHVLPIGESMRTVEPGSGRGAASELVNDDGSLVTARSTKFAAQSMSSVKPTYTSVPLTPPAARGSQTVIPAAANRDGCLYSGQGVKILKDTTIKYNKVLEAHSYQDSYASVSYSTTAGTSFSSGWSVDYGKTFKVGAGSYVGTSMGVGTGYSNKGPYFSYEWMIPIEHRKYEYWACGYVGGIYQKKTYQGTNVLAYRYKPSSRGYVAKYGDNVRWRDGYYAYKDAKYVHKVPRGTDFEINRGTSKKYYGSAEAFGFRFNAETAMSSNRKQRITAGNTTTSHYIFGNFPIGDNMRIFYAY